ncbi:MAG: DegQ family serine endoprotease, partial [Rhodospirillaceae bacterium]|nr:DegQ family serine endoprotease [Rhodospirillaceae bacterium]
AITFFAFTPLASARGAPDGFADLAAKVSPAVVNISTVGKRVVNRGFGADSTMPDVPKDSPFYELFRRFEQNMGPRTERMRALGSGFIIDPAGYVVTNNHVIKGAETVTVILQDGRKFPAKVIGADSKTDVALLKIQGDGKLPAVSFGDSDKARVGDWVMAVGNPFGLGGTVTAGIISARNRDLHSGPYDDYMQVDAAINKGNSGGPLFDMNGNVIGINTAIYSPNGGSVGIGFAIPASVAAPVIAQLREKGHIDRGWLGVSVQPVTEDLAKALGLDQAKGGLIAQVLKDSPAAKAGLKAGDVIRSVNGKTLEHSRDLPRIVAAIRKGETATFGVWRDGKSLTVEATIGGMPNEAAARSDEDATTGKGVYGVALAPLTPEQREAYSVPAGVHGVLILRVQDGSPAAEKGLKAGDVILRVGNHPVTSPAEAIAELNKAKAANTPAMLLILRNGERMFVAVKARSI